MPLRKKAEAVENISGFTLNDQAFFSHSSYPGNLLTQNLLILQHKQPNDAQLKMQYMVLFFAHAVTQSSQRSFRQTRL